MDQNIDPIVSNWENGFWAFFAQGARCGHVEAQDRVGQYVLGEEYELAVTAAAVNVAADRPVNRSAWEIGYCYGFRQRAEGSPLLDEIINAPLPV